MKEYSFKLLPRYFDFIKNGTKRIELRLNDKKRKNLKIGDIIVFNKLDDSGEFLKTKVINLYYADNFKDLIDIFDEEVIGDISVSKKEVLATLNEIYSFKEQESAGVVGIEIEII